MTKRLESYSGELAEMLKKLESFQEEYLKKKGSELPSLMIFI